MRHLAALRNRSVPKTNGQLELLVSFKASLVSYSSVFLHVVLRENKDLVFQNKTRRSENA